MASRSFGISLLLLGVAAGSLGGLVILRPDLPKDWFAPSPSAAATDPGDRPILPADLTATLESRQAQEDLTASVRLRQPAKPVILAPAPVVTAAPVKAVKVYSGDKRASETLAEAEKHYRAFQWAAAASSARRVAGFDANPALKTRAKDIAQGATAFADLFKNLDDRDELTRNYDTSPALVTIENGKEPMLAVPIRSLNDKEPVVVEQDPLGFIAQSRTAGKVAFLIRGKKDFFPTSLQDFGTVALVDQKAVLTAKSTEFKAKLDRLSASKGSADALAWYEAGKYAYRNRLDQHVVDQLARALRLDPHLVRTVREDKASSLFAHLVAHMKNGNKVQAASYMSSIERRYKDTDQGRQARLYFDGKQTELLKAAQESAAKDAEAERQRQEALRARADEAKRAGDAAAAKEAEEAIAAKPDPADEAPAEPVVAGDEGKADGIFAKGRELYAKAIEMGNTNERDVLYGEAYKFLNQSVQLFSALVEKEKDAKKREGLEMKLLEANKLKFGSIKQRRFH